MTTLEKIIKYTPVTFYLSICLIIGFASFAACHEDKEPVPQKSLSEVLIQKIEESPSDWTLTEVKKQSNTSDVLYSGLQEVLENKKCNIKIFFDFPRGINAGVISHLVSPDSIDFDVVEAASIYFAYEDTQLEVQKRIRLNKERKILDQLCK